MAKKNRRRKKYSVNERVAHYVKKARSSNPAVMGFADGYIIGITQGEVKSAKYAEKHGKVAAEAYLKGVNKGDAALRRSQKVKF